jgi:transcriptional regulator with XRE-family HTH domain
MKVNAELIRKAMKEQGLTQKELASRIGLTEGHLSKVINNKPKVSLSVPTREALSQELQIPYRDIEKE